VTPGGPAGPSSGGVLVAGCGYVGTAAGRLLAARGRTVWGLRRDPSGLPEAIEPLPLDLLDPELPRRLPPAIDAVLFTAAPGGGGEAAYRATYVNGLRALLEALESRPPERRPQRVIFTSSTAVYGDADGGWVDETTPPAPASWRGETMLEAERLLLASALPGVVLRLGGIYGPGRTRLLEQVRAGSARASAEVPLWSNRIHRDDAAAALVHLLELPDPAPLYLGVDDAPSPLHEVYAWVARRIGAPTPSDDPHATRDRSNKRASNRRLRASGFTFRFPSYREGYEAMIQAEGA
jgi:nucleoside-diphosphate-sugar epimerase